MNLELKTKILKSGKPQVALAREIGIPEPRLSRIVQGWVIPSEEIKKKLARALVCDVRDIFLS